MTDLRRRVALAIPAYNEADGIGEFLTELDSELGSSASVTIVVVDDASTDGTSERLTELAPQLSAHMLAERNVANRGHGPTTLRAYEVALGTGADVILQVDGDGHFDGSDVRKLLYVLDDADIALGQRKDRSDPWYRTALSVSLRVYLHAMFGVRTSDPNCPLRAYRREVLEEMLADVPDAALVPNVYLSVLAGAGRYRTRTVAVRHRPRRGSASGGSTWGPRRVSFLIPRRLLVLVAGALAESIRFRPVVHRVRRRTRELSVLGRDVAGRPRAAETTTETTHPATVGSGRTEVHHADR